MREQTVSKNGNTPRTLTSSANSVKNAFTLPKSCVGTLVTHLELKNKKIQHC